MTQKGSLNALRPVFFFLAERLTLAVAGVAAALAFFIVLAHEVHADETVRWDAAVFHYFQARQQPAVHALMTAVSFLASGWVISSVSVACLCAFWLRPPLRSRAVRLFLVAAGGQGVVYALKAVFHRARPEAMFASLGYSFPSGHSFAAVTIYGMLAYWLTREAALPRRWAIWVGSVALILLIGFSRVYLGVHYASDVAAGFASGVPWLWSCLTLPDRRKRK